MLKLKTLLKKTTNNLLEIWLATLLFLGLPLVVYLYTDWRGFLATTVIAQATVLILLERKGGK